MALTQGNPGVNSPGYQAWLTAQLAALNPSGTSMLAPTSMPGWAGSQLPPSPTSTPAPSAAGPFSGPGLFTAQNPMAALNSNAAWVAVQLGQVTPAEIAALKAQGKQVILWTAMAGPGDAAAVKALGVDGYIAQAETPAELAAALQYGNVGVPKALVGNPNDYQPAGWQYPPGWVAMPEAYTNTTSQQTVGAVVSDAKGRGATVVSPIFGAWNGGQGTTGTTTSMQQYIAAARAAGVGGNYGAYLAEQLSPADMATFNASGSPTANSTVGQMWAQNPTGQSIFGPGGPFAPADLAAISTATGTAYYPYAGGSGNPDPNANNPNPTGRTGNQSGNQSGNPNQTGNPALDYSGFLGFFKLPPDVQAYINGIFQKYSDPQQAQTIALAYVRGTPWYAATYPGIKEGIARGLFTDEQGYRSYLTQLDLVNQRFLGRGATVGDISQNIAQGWDINTYAKQLEGSAYVSANLNQIQYLSGNFGDSTAMPTGATDGTSPMGPGQLSPEQLTSLGQQQVGLTSTAGYALQAKLQQAQQRMQTIFQGVLASPRFSVNPYGQGPGRLTATSQSPLGSETSAVDIAR